MFYTILVKSLGSLSLCNKNPYFLKWLFHKYSIPGLFPDSRPVPDFFGPGFPSRIPVPDFSFPDNPAADQGSVQFSGDRRLFILENSDCCKRFEVVTQKKMKAWIWKICFSTRKCRKFACLNLHKSRIQIRPSIFVLKESM